MVFTASAHHKQAFLRLAMHYLEVRDHGTCKQISKDEFEAVLIGLAMHVGFPKPADTLAHGRWTKALMQLLDPEFKWDGKAKGSTKKLTTTRLAFVDHPILRLDGTEQLKVICAQLRTESAVLTVDLWREFKDVGQRTQRSYEPRRAQADATVPPEVLSMVLPSYEQPTSTTWLVPAGAAMGAFMIAGGPSAITDYVWCSGVSKVEETIVQRTQAIASTPGTIVGTHDYLDTFELTALGESLLAKSPDRVVYKRGLYCSGRGARSKPAGLSEDGAPSATGTGNGTGTGALLLTTTAVGHADYSGPRPNCRRYCGGMGECVAGCQSRNRGHHCNCRVVITATLRQISERKLHIELQRSHVPSGYQAVPPPKEDALYANRGTIERLRSTVWRAQFEEAHRFAQGLVFQERLVNVLLNNADVRVRNYLLQHLMAGLPTFQLGSQLFLQ